jgi:acetyl-CoA carboxylase carboxyl transferase subunit alpha
MFEYACYSVITPEGCASILYRQRTAESVAQAAEALRLTARDLLGLGVIDEIVAEPPGGAHRHARASMQALESAIERHLAELRQVSGEELRRLRFEKFRRMGVVAG